MKGYTLIEVLVSLTIVGLIFSFGFANFRDFSRRQHLTSVGRSLQADLRLIQEKAFSGVKPDDLKCIGSNTLESYSFDLTSDAGYDLVAVCSGGNVIVKSQILPSDVSLTATIEPISFKVLGHGTNLAQGSQAEIILTQEETANTLSVIVTSGGEVK